MKARNITPGFWYIKGETGIDIARVERKICYSWDEEEHLYAYTTGYELPFRVDEFIEDFIRPVPTIQEEQANEDQ